MEQKRGNTFVRFTSPLKVLPHKNAGPSFDTPILPNKKMQEMGLEPTRSCDHRHLKPARLPIPPLLHLLLVSRFRATA
jgi:hypothetical protein